jgi:hypothetical protein
MLEVVFTRNLFVTTHVYGDRIKYGVKVGAVPVKVTLAFVNPPDAVTNANWVVKFVKIAVSPDPGTVPVLQLPAELSEPPLGACQ